MSSNTNTEIKPTSKKKKKGMFYLHVVFSHWDVVILPLS